MIGYVHIQEVGAAKGRHSRHGALYVPRKFKESGMSEEHTVKDIPIGIEASGKRIEFDSMEY